MLTISYSDMFIIIFSVFALTYAVLDGLDLLSYKVNKSKCVDIPKTKKVMVSQKDSIRGRNIERIMNKH